MMADAHVIRHNFGSRPLLVNTHDRPADPVTVWQVGPDPEASRGQARDLSAAAEAFQLRSAHVVAEASLVAMLTDPEIKGLHTDRLAEAIAHARAQIDVIERLAQHPTEPEAA